MLDDMPGMAPPPRRRAAGGETGDGAGGTAAAGARFPAFVKRLPPPPDFVTRPFLQQFMAGLVRRHPRMFARLGEYGGRRFLIDPVDLPFVLLLVPSPRLPRLELHPRTAPPAWDAAVRGTMPQLLAMAEGRADGDALFFSRDLVIEGDTEAVLALRNAIDDARLDLIAEVAATFGPAGGLLLRARGAGRALMAAVARMRAADGADEGGGAAEDAGADTGPVVATGGGGGA